MSKVVFYTCKLQEVDTMKNVAYNDTYQIVTSILDERATQNEGYRTLDIQMSGQNSFDVSLDVIKNNNDYLFGRLGKEKDLKALGIRDKNTKRYSSVLSKEDVGKKTIEVSTFFLLDYSVGIISFIKGHDAPRIGCLAQVIQNFNDKYIMSFDNIINPVSIKSLLKDGSAITKIKYSFALPSVEMLKQAGLNREQLACLKNLDTYEAEVVIKGLPRKAMTADGDVIRSIINTFSEKRDNLKELIFSGKEPKVAMNTYSFEDDIFQYNVDIAESHKKDDRVVFYTPLEIAINTYEKLAAKYQEHRSDLILYGGKI